MRLGLFRMKRRSRPVLVVVGLLRNPIVKLTSVLVVGLLRNPIVKLTSVLVVNSAA
jgi:hypothetical protein